MKIRKFGTMAVATLCIAAMGVDAAPPALAQSNQEQARIRKLEAEVRALQRRVFPGSNGRFFEPEISNTANNAATPVSPNATNAVTDILARLDAMEARIASLTAHIEQNDNTLRLLSERLDAIDGGTVGGSGSSVGTTVSNAVNNGSQIIGGAAGNVTSGAGTALNAAGNAIAGSSGAINNSGNAITGAAGAALAGSRTTVENTGGRLASQAGAALNSAASGATGGSTGGSTVSNGPNAERLAAVQLIAKPQTDDAGDDEYSYGFRLWNAGYYPEAQQQLAGFVEKNPSHWRATYARNLLGRAFLDDKKPREAAPWFLNNYQADKQAARAADSLLYLAESMIALNDTGRACIALAEFGETYPALASGRLGDQYQANLGKVDCD